MHHMHHRSPIMFLGASRAAIVGVDSILSKSLMFALFTATGLPPGCPMLAPAGQSAMCAPYVSGSKLKA